MLTIILVWLSASAVAMLFMRNASLASAREDHDFELALMEMEEISKLRQQKPR
jgi:hypothetical protein